MKLKNKFLVILLAVVFAFTMFAMTACGDDPGPADEVSISLSTNAVSLIAGGDNATVTATVKGTTKTAEWSLANGGDAIVTITPNGNTVTIAPKAAGTTTVTAKVEGKTAACTVTVDPAAAPTVAIALSETTLSLIRGGDNATVTATLTNAEDDATVTWSLADGGDAVVTITPDGNTVSVAPIAVGTTTLTAKLGDATADVAITVTKAPVTLVLDKEKVELKMGEEDDETVKLTETVTATATNNDEAVVWKIGSERIATISADGDVCTVTAVNVGTTTLTASVEGKVKTISVVVDGTAGEIELVLSEEEDFELNVGAEKTVSATVVGTLETPVWSVDDDEVIEIVGEGNEITVKALKEGDATLTVTVGEATETIVITVVDPVSLSIDKESLDLKVGGEVGTINVTAQGATGEYTYDVDGDCITVTKNGNALTVTPVKEGEATVTVSYGGKTVECAVTVSDIPVIKFDIVENFGEVPGQFFGQKVIFGGDIVTDECTMEVVAKVNGAVVTPILEQHIYTGAVNDVQVQVPGTRYDDIEIDYTFKKDGAIVAKAHLSYVGVKEITLSVDLITIEVGETGTVTVTAVNGNIADKTVTWSIEDVEGENVATLPEIVTGNSIVITAVTAGKAILTATVGVGENAITKTCEVTVSEEPVLPPEDVDITAGITNQFVYNDIFLQVEWNFGNIENFNAADVKNYEVSAVKNDQPYNVAIQNRMGITDTNVVGTGVQINIFNAPSGSTLTITINFLNGANQVIGHAVVNVDPPKTLTLSPSSLTFTLIEVEDGDSTAEGVETKDVTATISSNVTGTIAWTIEDEGVATISVSDDGLSVTVTAVAAGETTIKANVDGLEKTCRVKVVDPKDGGDGEDDVETLTVTEIRKDGAVYLIANMGKHFDFSYIKTSCADGTHNTPTKNEGNNRWDGATNFLIFAANADFAPTDSGNVYIVEFYDADDTLIARAEVECP